MTRLTSGLVTLLITASAASAHGMHPPVGGAGAHDAAHWALSAGIVLLALAVGAGLSLFLSRRDRS